MLRFQRKMGRIKKDSISELLQEAMYKQADNPHYVEYVDPHFKIIGSSGKIVEGSYNVNIQMTMEAITKLPPLWRPYDFSE